MAGEPRHCAALRDLRAHDVDMVTIGQYLQPTPHHHPVLRYWTPDEFKALEDFGMALGFTHVASGPLVRSSYHADQQAAGAGVAAKRSASSPSCSRAAAASGALRRLRGGKAASR